MREIDHHPELVHLTNDAPSKVIQACGRAIRHIALTAANPRQVVVPHQRQHAHSVGMKRVQVVEVFLDRMAAFDAGNAGDEAACACCGAQ